jgi:murein DD-endopeptidase / murein LD-carboxypeptidase
MVSNFFSNRINRFLLVLFVVFSISSILNANNSISKLKNKALEREVKLWLGTPYRMGGTTKSGTDCSGFVGNVYSAVYGIKLTRSSKDMVKEVSKTIKKPRKLKEGDLVFFKIKGNRVSHVGIYLNDGNFVHASTSRGVIINNLNEDYYKKRFYRGGRFK